VSISWRYTVNLRIIQLSHFWQGKISWDVMHQIQIFLGLILIGRLIQPNFTTLRWTHNWSWENTICLSSRKPALSLIFSLLNNNRYGSLLMSYSNPIGCLLEVMIYLYSAFNYRFLVLKQETVSWRLKTPNKIRPRRWKIDVANLSFHEKAGNMTWIIIHNTASSAANSSKVRSLSKMNQKHTTDRVFIELQGPVRTERSIVLLELLADWVRILACD
jgi:hypothetical protein